MPEYVSKKAACPCGSGKKYKHCCGGPDAPKKRDYRPFIIGAVVLVVVFGVFAALGAARPSEPAERVWPSLEEGALPPLAADELLQELPAVPAAAPSEEGPEGLVWSPEHNHWH